MANLEYMKALCQSADGNLKVTLTLIDPTEQTEMIWMVFVAPEPEVYDEMLSLYPEISRNDSKDEEEALIRTIMNVLINYCVYDVMSEGYEGHRCSVCEQPVEDAIELSEEEVKELRKKFEKRLKEACESRPDRIA
jgi:hypothetical protein